jgi:hypothetical protein
MRVVLCAMAAAWAASIASAQEPKPLTVALTGGQIGRLEALRQEQRAIEAERTSIILEACADAGIKPAECRVTADWRAVVQAVPPVPRTPDKTPRDATEKGAATAEPRRPQ